MRRLEQKIRAAIRPLRGRIGISVVDVESDAHIGIDDEQLLPMASVCKVPILTACMRLHDRMALDLNEKLVFTRRDRTLGSGLLSAFDDKFRLSIRDYLLMMICVSDNGATDRLLRRVGLQRVNEEMAALGLGQIDLSRTIQQQIDAIYTHVDPRFAQCRFGEHEELVNADPELKRRIQDIDCIRKAIREVFAEHDTASARDLSKLLMLIARGKCASADSCQAMLDIMGRQCLNTRLPRFIPPFAKFPHKTGTYGFGVVVNDIGVLMQEEKPRYAVSVLATDLHNPLYETEEILGKIGRAVYDFMEGG